MATIESFATLRAQSERLQHTSPKTDENPVGSIVVAFSEFAYGICPCLINSSISRYLILRVGANMSIYDDWGLSDNPFQTTSLPATLKGSQLLVGRDEEIERLIRRIKNPPKLPTIEGLNGVGKSSLVNVAAYECYISFLNDPDQPMLVPCRRSFQLDAEQGIQEFIDNVLREVAQTLIEEADSIENGSIESNHRSNQLDKWLNSPQLSAYEGGIAWISAGKSSETNTGEGFQRSGFRKSITEWLAKLFPTPRDGGGYLPHRQSGIASNFRSCPPQIGGTER
ncbi:hypothetical protein OAL44_00690 [Planctomycetaceae bacterium]|nr:hypothetical protein [Planctomycetaceae bacterium]